MHDRHQILHHLLFRREPLLIQYQQLAAVGFGVMLKPLEAKASQAITVGKHYTVLTSRGPIAFIKARNRLRLKFRPPPTSSMNSTLANPRATTNFSSTLR